jgi:hypothetical protein
MHNPPIIKGVTPVDGRLHILRYNGTSYCGLHTLQFATIEELRKGYDCNFCHWVYSEPGAKVERLHLGAIASIAIAIEEMDIVESLRDMGMEI